MPGLAGSQLADLEDRGTDRDRGGHQEREPGGRFAVQAGEAGRRDADPRAADAGHEREGLRRPDRDRDRERDVADALGLATPSVGQPQDDRAHDERDGDQPDLAECGLDEVVEQESGDRRGDGRRHEEPRQAAVRIGPERAIPDGGKPGRHQPQPVGPEVDEQRRQRPDVEHHAERQRRDERVGPAQQVRDDDEVPGRGDRQELGESLDDPHDQGLDVDIHQVRTSIFMAKS